LAAGVLLAVTSAAYALPKSVRAEVRDDGSVIIERVRYTDPAPLRVAVKRLKQRHALIHVWGKPSVKFDAVRKMLLLMQKAGCEADCMKIGFVTGPASSH
jgi:hypothetical protein